MRWSVIVGPSDCGDMSARRQYLTRSGEGRGLSAARDNDTITQKNIPYMLYAEVHDTPLTRRQLQDLVTTPQPSVVFLLAETTAQAVHARWQVTR